MTTPHEIELKLEMPVSGTRALQRDALFRRERGKRYDVVSVYFDTNKLKLRKNGVSLRIRRIDNRFVQTIKYDGAAKGAVLDRSEWETQVASLFMSILTRASVSGKPSGAPSR
jgi:inorganic triphosphatase YgiF